jgi:hypothetical protein
MADVSEQLTDWCRKRGGPTTVKGKNNSSQNAHKHGCRAKRKILKGESRRDYNKLWRLWEGEYPPQTEADQELLELLVDCAWRLKRTEEALVEMESMVKFADGADSRQALTLQVGLRQRYRTTAENSFYKAMRVLDARKKASGERIREIRRKNASEAFDHQRLAKLDPEYAEVLRLHVENERKADEAARAEHPAQELFRGQDYLQKGNPVAYLEQAVEVRVVDGATLTTQTPSNEELIEQGKTMMPPPQFVGRVIEFVGGLVPAEYAWVGMVGETAATEGDTEESVSGDQLMTPDTWLRVIAQEKLRGDGHVGPTGVGNCKKPRTAWAPGCRCPQCVRQANVTYWSARDKWLPRKKDYSMWGTW